MKGARSKDKKADSKLAVRKKPERAKKVSKKAAKDPNKPKRPPSAFFVFMEEFRTQYKEKHPNNKSVSVVGKAGGEKWKSLSESDKAPYVAKAAKRKADYTKSMAAYNKKETERSAEPDDEEESDKSKSEVHDDDEDESGEEGEQLLHVPVLSLVRLQTFTFMAGSLDSCCLLRIAITSRLLILALIALFRSVASPYDTSASINPECLYSNATNISLSGSVLFPRLGSLIESSIVWDGVYFLRIAECGYEYEQTYAFLPLLPISIRLLSQSIFAPLVRVLGYRAVLALSGYVINNVAFIFAAVYFHRISLFVLRDRKAAYQASVLFCFNPASIFYSSVYSESLYSLFSLGGIYCLLVGSNTLSVLLLALSGFARSNGVLNAGYFCFRAFHDISYAIFQKGSIGLAVWVFLVAAVRTLCILAPFIAFQSYGYLNICLENASDDLRPWCKARLPLIYDYIQSHYWGVGFLRYFQLKQLPNFLLASPILSLAVYSIVRYVKLRPEVVFSLGFRASHEEKEAAFTLHFDYADKNMSNAHIADKLALSETIRDGVFEADQHLRLRKHKNTGKSFVPLTNRSSVDHADKAPAYQGYSSLLILPFVLQLAFMSLVAFFVMHVQVSTRFLSASPPIYWFASYLITSSNAGRSFVIWVYFVLYILLGSLLFSNFYPFT